MKLGLLLYDRDINGVKQKINLMPEELKSVTL